VIVGGWNKSWKLGGEEHLQPQRLEEVNPQLHFLTTTTPHPFPVEVDKILVHSPLAAARTPVQSPARVPALAPSLDPDPLRLADVTPPLLPLAQIDKDPFLLPAVLAEAAHPRDPGRGVLTVIDQDQEAGVGVIRDRGARVAADHHREGGSGGIVPV